MERHYKVLCADSGECRRAIGVPETEEETMDNTKVFELIECLAQHGISVNAHELPLHDPNDLLERIISACHDAARAEEHYQPVEATAGIQMSLDVPLMGHTLRVAKRRPCSRAADHQKVDAFFEMLPGRGGK